MGDCSQQVSLGEGQTSSMAHEEAVQSWKQEAALQKDTLFKITVAFYHQHNLAPEPAGDFLCYSSGEAFIGALRDHHLDPVPSDHPQHKEWSQHKHLGIAQHGERQFGKQIEMHVLS